MQVLVGATGALECGGSASVFFDVWLRDMSFDLKSRGRALTVGHIFLLTPFPCPFPWAYPLHTLGLALAFALVPNSCLQLIPDHSC